MTVSLTQTKVDTVYERSAAIGDKVRRLDIAMDEMPTVHNFHAFQHLIGDHQYRFEGEPPSAFVELILKRRSEQIHNHEVVGVLRSEVMDLGEARGILEFAVYLVFMAELGAARAVFFEFHGDLFAVGAHAEIDVTEGTAAYSFGDAVFGDGGLHSI